MYSVAHELLRPYERSHKHAVVMVDADWEGSPGATAMRMHISERMAVRWQEFGVIVIEPELEAWLMNENAHLVRIFRCPEDYRQILWLEGQSFRLDSSPYLSGAYEARKLLERIPWTVPLRDLTTGYNGGIFNGPKFSRLYTNDPEWGVPFLGSTDMLEADFTNLPLLHRKLADQFPYLEIKPGMSDAGLASPLSSAPLTVPLFSISNRINMLTCRCRGSADW